MIKIIAQTKNTIPIRCKTPKILTTLKSNKGKRERNKPKPNNMLALFNADKISYRYEDDIFTTTDGVHFGTRVHLLFPITYNYEPPE